MRNRVLIAQSHQVQMVPNELEREALLDELQLLIEVANQEEVQVRVKERHEKAQHEALLEPLQEVLVKAEDEDLHNSLTSNGSGMSLRVT